MRFYCKAADDCYYENKRDEKAGGVMANTSIRMDDNLKKQVVREQEISFKSTRETPNRETVAAINEVQQMKQNPSRGKAYMNVDKMMEKLLYEI